ncbi:peptidoglycan-binding protein [Bacillus marinisedimentorum]|uniref:peptidoglycan-binding protein n=1 Tax=Bacillus marinisedimentorum TaxID=1821260 RepID=UPI000A7D8771|nr:peptidoglycan-binding protein [Bacillus marinisedimentorum]
MTNIVKKLFIAALLAAGVGIAFPAASEAALGDRMLAEGMWHEDVKELQQVLLSKGYFPYPKDTGYYGPVTTEAVQGFQRDNGLKVDGIAGPDTIGKLKVTRYGDIGQPVIGLQKSLQAAGLYDGNIDGIYGGGTKDAVINFQKKHGLAVDGIAGPQTHAALRNKVGTPGTDVIELSMESTAYTADCEGCSGTTRMGIDLAKYGGDAKVIAVDPAIVPLGSKVEVEGYGTAIAADIGGAINDYSIDVFIPNRDDALKWGRKNVNVKIYQ